MNLLTIKFREKNFKKLIIFYFFKILDTSIWLIIKLLPNKFIWKSVKLRPFKIINFRLSINFRNKLRKTIKYFLNLISIKSSPYSSCLSRSILGMILLDFLSIDNVLRVGIIKYIDGKKATHTWLVDPINEELFVPSGYMNLKLVYFVEI